MTVERTRAFGPGETIGAWVVVRAIAEGGFGTVYEVRHQSSGERAALKLLHAHLGASGEMLARFDREVQVVGMVRHDNVVRLVDAGFSREGRPYLCMELLVGDDLATALRKRGALTRDHALAVFSSVCEAVAAAHDLGVIHRDIKASNVMLCESGRVVLLDFGIAKLADAIAPELTQTAQMLGTPSCMAPEQIQGLRPDPRTDVYALGGLLFHALTGAIAFDDASVTMSQYLHLHARRPKVSKVVPVSARVDDLIARAMAIEPADRFPDVRALLAAARVALRDTAVVAAAGEVDAAAILVSVVEPGEALDEALLADVEGVLPAAERALAELGFSIAVDLGSSALFVAPADRCADPVAAAVAAWRRLATRPHADSRVVVGMCVHRGRATFVGTEVRPCDLIRPATWRIPDVLDGVWVTAGVSGAPTATRVA